MKYLPNLSSNLRLLFSIVMLLVVLVLQQNVQAQTRIVSKHVVKDDKVKIYTSKNSFSALEIEYKGEIKVSDDDKSITYVEPGGFIAIGKTTFGNKRGIKIESDKSGNLSYAYYIGKKEQDYEPEGRKWLADILLEVIRTTGLAAESRVKRIYSKGGVNAVLSEVGEIQSNSGRRLYLSYLMEQGTHSSTELASILRKVNNISSSSSKGSFLRAYHAQFFDSKDEGVTQAYFDAVGRISSSSEKGSILRKVLAESTLSASMWKLLLETCARISSDSEKGSVLRMALAHNLPQNKAVYTAFLQTLDQISSSSEKGATLRRFLDVPSLSEEIYSRIFESVSRVSSSSEKGSILRKVIAEAKTQTVFSDDFFSAVNGVSSSSEKGAIMRSLLHKENLSEQVLLNILEGTSRITSNAERGSILRSMIARQTLNNTVSIALLDTSTSLTSSSEQGSVLRLLARDVDISDEAVKKAFMEAAENLSSDSEYRSVMSVFNRN